MRNRHRLMSFGSALVVGVVVYVVVPAWLHGATRFVAAYDAAIVTLLTFFWKVGLHADARLTRARAALDDPGRNSVLLIVLGTVVVGLVSAVAIIGHGPQVKDDVEKWTAYAFGVLAYQMVAREFPTGAHTSAKRPLESPTWMLRPPRSS